MIYTPRSVLWRGSNPVGTGYRLMKEQTLVIFFTALLLVSCNHTSTGPGNGMSPVSGFLEGWQSGVFTESLHFAIAGDNYFLPLDSSYFSSTGMFSIPYPFPAPPDSTLHAYRPLQLSSPSVDVVDSLSFSGVDPRYVLGSIYVHFLRAGLTCPVKRANALVSSDSAISDGDFYSEYFYSPVPMYISGWKRTVIKLPTSSSQRYRVFFTRADFSAAAGWNSVTTIVESIHDSTIEYRVSNSFPESAKWFQTWGIPYNFRNSVYL
jgi:hypothetical protein